MEIKNVKHYFPNVICRFTRNGKPRLISSCESCFTIEQAESVINVRKEQYECLCSWIDDGNGHLLMFENYVNAFGNIDHVTRFNVMTEVMMDNPEN